jgi:UDP-N-acetylmuramoylalanine--D-glutamate ligase
MAMQRFIRRGDFFHGIKALVMGLGLHGGGVATATWLAQHGARVTATDMRQRKLLEPSIAALKGVPVCFVLGKHSKEDFRSHDLVVANPGIPRESTYLALARRAGKRIENDASLFFRLTDAPTIAVTGTRGKTTTTLWIAELLKKNYPKVRPSGNTPDNAFLKEFDRVQGKGIPVVAEMSSWQLEYLPAAFVQGGGLPARGRAPHVAVITNIYADHLNRYAGGMADYASAKANIFRVQQDDDFLVLNYDNAWTKFFLKQHPRGLVFFVSARPLPKRSNGLFVREKKLIFRFDGIEQQLFDIEHFLRERGTHNLENLLSAVLAVKLFDPTVVINEACVRKLPTPPMRQEIIYKKRKLTIVNDSCATSPDGTLAAIKRFTDFRCQMPKDGGRIILIVGGTDKELEFDALARAIKRHIPPEQLILLNGSATTKLFGALHELGYDRKHPMVAHEDLASCMRAALAVAALLKGETTILFSPGAASFEKFLHEFDRGKQFKQLVYRMVR